MAILTTSIDNAAAIAVNSDSNRTIDKIHLDGMPTWGGVVNRSIDGFVGGSPHSGQHNDFYADNRKIKNNGQGRVHKVPIIDRRDRKHIKSLQK